MIPPLFESVLLVHQNPVAGREAPYDDWYTHVHIRDAHARAIMALGGISSAGLFELHDEQSLPNPAQFTMAAVYSLKRRSAAIAGWSAAQSGDGDCGCRSMGSRSVAEGATR